MSKIFGIGFGKTGLTSLHHALKILGYSCRKDIENLKEIDTDASIVGPRYFKDLDKSYPGSRFIYTVREQEAWLRSSERYWHRVKHKWLQDPGKLAMRRKDFGIEGFDRAAFIAAYERYDKQVRAYFRERDDLLIFNAIDGWDRLCPFLGHAVPSVPFPRENLAKNVPLRKHIKTYIRTYVRKWP